MFLLLNPLNLTLQRLTSHRRMAQQIPVPSSSASLLQGELPADAESDAITPAFLHTHACTKSRKNAILVVQRPLLFQNILASWQGYASITTTS